MKATLSPLASLTLEEANTIVTAAGAEARRLDPSLNRRRLHFRATEARG